jgi:hypothetical protein
MLVFSIGLINLEAKIAVEIIKEKYEKNLIDLVSYSETILAFEQIVEKSNKFLSSIHLVSEEEALELLTELNEKFGEEGSENG